MNYVFSIVILRGIRGASIVEGAIVGSFLSSLLFFDVDPRNPQDPRVILAWSSRDRRSFYFSGLDTFCHHPRNEGQTDGVTIPPTPAPRRQPGTRIQCNTMYAQEYWLYFVCVFCFAHSLSLLFYCTLTFLLDVYYFNYSAYIRVLWSFLFYISQFACIISSVFSYHDTVVTYIIHRYPRKRRKQKRIFFGYFAQVSARPLRSEYSFGYTYVFFAKKRTARWHLQEIADTKYDDKNRVDHFR